MKNKIFILSAAIFLIFNYGVSHAEPTITNIEGYIANGQTITISGSGFGDKVPAAPLIWDDFEDGTLDVAATTGQWSSIDNGLSIDNNVVHSGSYSVSGSISEDVCTLMKRLEEIGDGGKIYVYLWRRYSQSVSGYNQKFFRIWPSSSNYPNLVSSWHGGGLVISEKTDSARWFPNNPIPPAGRWFNEEIEVQLSSTANAADGFYQYTRDGDRKAQYNDLTTRSSSYPDIMNRLYIDNYGELPGYVYMDNIYIDNTFSRVIVGNAAEFEASTERAIQIPLVWSNSSIEVELNLEGINYENAYLYVIDSNNQVSQSHPLDPEGTESSTALAPPMNFQIN